MLASRLFVSINSASIRSILPVQFCRKLSLTAFEKAVQLYGPKISEDASNQQKLRAYALYKQATVGDNAKPAPSSFDMVGKYKWNAWKELQGMPVEEAKRLYVEEFKEFGGEAAEEGVKVVPAQGPVNPAPQGSGPKGAFLPVRTSPMLPAGTFSGQVALVTGGGTGLGRAMATMLASLGATVVISSRKADVIAAAARAINDQLADAGALGHGRVLAIPADVRDAVAVAAALDFCEKEAGGPPTLIVNNAAGNFISPFERMTSNGFGTLTDIVLKGTANVTLDAGKRLIKAGKGGVFLAITTTYAPDGSGYVVASAAAKSGVHALTKSLAAEWGKYGLRFVGIAPGPIETEGAFSRLDPTGEFKALLTDRLPSKRLGDPAELANLACYLLSSYASWMSGSIVDLDGGEKPALGGEFNALDRVQPAQWDALETMIRKGNKKE